MSGVRVTLLGQWARFLLQVVGYVALARLLAPADFGVVAMVAPVVAIATVLTDSGLSLAAIQATHLSRLQKNNLFWLNAVAGVLAASLVAASGPLLSWLYRAPEIASLAVALAAPLLLGGVTVQFRAEINRNERYGVLAAQDLVAAVTGLVTAVAAALLGYGYWALAIQLIVQAVALLVLAIAQSGWLPGLPSKEPMRSLLLFGGNSLIIQLLNLLSRSVDVVVVGRDLGATAAGLYSRGNQLLTLTFQQVVTPLTRVMVPRLSRVSPARFSSTVVDLERTTAYPLLAVISLLASFADPVLPILLGPEWSGIPTIVRIVCVGAVFQAVGYVCYWSFVARARTGTLLLAETPGRVAMIVGALVAAPYGVEAVAWAVALGQAIVAAGSMLAVSRVGVSRTSLIAAATRPVLLFGGAYASSALVSSGANGVVGLVLALAAWIVSVVAIVLLVRPIRRDVASLGAALR